MEDVEGAKIISKILFDAMKCLKASRLQDSMHLEVFDTLQIRNVNEMQNTGITKLKAIQTC